MVLPRAPQLFYMSPYQVSGTPPPLPFSTKPYPLPNIEEHIDVEVTADNTRVWQGKPIDYHLTAQGNVETFSFRLTPL